MDTADQNSESLRKPNRKHHSSAFAPVHIQPLLLNMRLFACMWSQQITTCFFVQNTNVICNHCATVCLMSPLHG